MRRSTRPIPDGYHTITPTLVLGDAQKALDFYRKAFGAEVVSSMSTSDGRIMHAEVRIGDSMLFVSDEYPEWSPETRSPQGSVTGTIFLYVRDADASYRRAVEAGARAVMPVKEMFWGDRFGKVVDPFGHHWGIATHTEDLSQQEIERRRDEFLSGPPTQWQQGPQGLQAQRRQHDRSNRTHDSRRDQTRQEVRMDSTKDTVRDQSRNDPQRDQRGQSGQGGSSGRGGSGGDQGGQGGRSGQGGQGGQGDRDRDRQGGQGGYQGGQGGQGGNEPVRGGQGGQGGQGGRQGHDNPDMGQGGGRTGNRRDQDQ